MAESGGGGTVKDHPLVRSLVPNLCMLQWASTSLVITDLIVAVG